MTRVGLYLTDLPLHDSSRDLVLAGSQQTTEIKLAFAKVRTYVVRGLLRLTC